MHLELQRMSRQNFHNLMSSDQWISPNWLLCSTFLQYDFVELLDGSKLIAKERRASTEPEARGQMEHQVSLHQAGFIQYLDSGVWHLAFYNDGKRPETVSYNTIILGKGHPCRNGWGGHCRFVLRYLLKIIFPQVTVWTFLLREWLDSCHWQARLPHTYTNQEFKLHLQTIWCKHNLLIGLCELSYAYFMPLHRMNITIP